jgi:hypothetical protein
MVTSSAVRSRPPRRNRHRRVLQLSATRHGFTVAGLEPEPELAPPVFEDFGLAHACAWALCEQLTHSASHSDGETPVPQADPPTGAGLSQNGNGEREWRYRRSGPRRMRSRASWRLRLGGTYSCHQSAPALAMARTWRSSAARSFWRSRPPTTIVNGLAVSARLSASDRS